jgi:hypothetical protein
MVFVQGELSMDAAAALENAVIELYGDHSVTGINDGPDGHVRILAAYTRAIDGLTNEKDPTR